MNVSGSDDARSVSANPTRVSWVLDSDGNRVGVPVEPGVATRPGGTILIGDRVRIEPLDVLTHGDDLWQACHASTNPSLWTYMLAGPFDSAAEFRNWVELRSKAQDAVFYAVVDVATSRALGVVSYLRIDVENRVIEVGNISFFDELARSASATEAMTLMAAHAFDLGYRRYEWKCNVLNEPSLRAAERLGFSFEGVFRNAIVVRGYNRDTAWFAMTDGDWPAIREAHRQWLDASNFDADGQQRKSLRDMTSGLIVGRFPTVSIDIE
ncbi:MAG: GNAT family N-acetyltransferase [Microbacteriaceae bacterium]